MRVGRNRSRLAGLSAPYYPGSTASTAEDIQHMITASTPEASNLFYLLENKTIGALFRAIQ